MWLAGLFLAHSRAVDGMYVWRDNLYLWADEIAAAELTVDREIEPHKITISPFRLQFWSGSTRCLERSAGFAPVNLPLFHGPYQAGRTTSGRISRRAMARANSDKILNSPVPTAARLGMLTVALALDTAS